MLSIVPRVAGCLIAIWLAPAIAGASDTAEHDTAGHDTVEHSTRPIDEARAKAAGIRRLSSQHLVLFTDVRSSPETDELPQVFDKAFSQWCDYFHIEARQHEHWQLTGYLMRDKARFAASGLMPDDLPAFLNGYSRNFEFWVFDQTNPYYQRHLLLHEGTHCFMFTLLGGCGPPWYAEGMAELLATHRWQAGELTLRYYPSSAQEVPKLGRIEIVQTDFAAGHAMNLNYILAYDARAHLKNEPYGWCWAAAAFLDGHPSYRERFRKLPKLVTERNFNERFVALFAADWGQMSEQWQVFAANLDYGYDLEHTKLNFTAGKPLAASGAQVSVAADLGWQNSGLRLEAGKTYKLQASGRYQLAKEPKIWWCEPGGVTIRYNHGLPLGVLLAALRADDRPPGAVDKQPVASSGLIRPIVVGLGTQFTPQQSGTLYFRVNDSCGELSDNSGTLTVTIVAQ